MTERTDAAERMDRLRVVAIAMDEIVREVGPRLIMLAHLRNEARQIMEEMGAGSRS